MNEWNDAVELIDIHPKACADERHRDEEICYCGRSEHRLCSAALIDSRQREAEWVFGHRLTESEIDPVRPTLVLISCM